MTMSDDEVQAASDKELIAAWMRDGFSRAQAEGSLAAYRSGWD